jgi:hypothetical protein
MPVVKIESIKDRTRTSKKGKKYKVVEVQGTKYGTDENWSTDIFKNQEDLLESLEEFGPGELVNFKFTKNGNFYDLTELSEPDAEMLEKIDAGEFDAPKKTTGGTRKGGGSTMSKEEWAEKDRLTNIRIAKAVALKAAIDMGKKTTKTILAQAEEFLPYLLTTDDDVPFDTSEAI